MKKTTILQLDTAMDGLPNEVRGCYTDDEWVSIIETYSIKETIPTSSSHIYQCAECCTEFENVLPALDYWNSPEGQAHTAKQKKKIAQWLKQEILGS